MHHSVFSTHPTVIPTTILFLQWFKSYFDGVTGNQRITDYDGAGRRAMCKTGDVKVRGRGVRAGLGIGH